MTKRKAILLVLGGEAVIYLFLFVGMPLIVDWVYSCTDCTGGKELGVTLKPVYRILKFIPALIGAWIVLMIWKKKEAKSE